MSRVFTGAVLLAALVTAACGTARRAEPLGTAPVLSTEAEKQGEAVFMRRCDKCHVGGDAALGPALNNKPLPGFLIRFQVRNGLGAMPSFSERQVSDSDLDALVAYLQALRRAGD